MQTTTAPQQQRLLLVFALALIVGGGWLAHAVQTAGGIEIKDVRFAGTGGRTVSALLYIPNGATAKNPVPGILAIHGYINSRETQSGFAIEYARRGYVVLAPDQSGHGYSDPAAYARGFGGPDALKYLRSLDIVDPDNVGLEGHSMGGWAVQVAAARHPNDYRSIVLVGSSTGTFGAPAGTADTPRNIGIVFSKYDEFSGLMWGAPIPRDIVHGAKLKRLFGTPGDVEIGKLYGSIDAGNARMLYMPATTHPQDHISTEAIGNAIDWMQRTLRGGTPLPVENQIWYWKELGTLLALIGAALGVFALGGILLRTRYFSALACAPAPAKGVNGGWWLSAALSMAIPVASYFWLYNFGTRTFPASAFFPQAVTSGIVIWAFGNALIALLLFGAWHVVANRSAGAARANYGTDPRSLALALQLAVALIAWVAALLALCDFLFKIDFRFWVVALKLPSLLQLKIMVGYLPAFAVFFLIQGLLLNGQLRNDRRSFRRELVVNMVLSAGGFVALLLAQYLPLFRGGTLSFGEPLLTIVAWQFVPLLAFAAAASTYFFRATGSIYAGAAFNALFVTWYIVAGQATHFAF
jgi:pimeloyl-ACP methyl ester carboxylesterase